MCIFVSVMRRYVVTQENLQFEIWNIKNAVIVDQNSMSSKLLFYRFALLCFCILFFKLRSLTIFVSTIYLSCISNSVVLR